MKSSIHLKSRKNISIGDLVNIPEHINGKVNQLGIILEKGDHDDCNSDKELNSWCTWVVYCNNETIYSSEKFIQKLELNNEQGFKKI